MNGFYTITESLYNTLMAKGFNVVTLGDNYKVDLERQTIFPYAHIVPGTVTKIGNTKEYSFSIIGMDLIDFNKDKVTTYFSNDNMQDVLNDIDNKLSQVAEYYERAIENAGYYSVEVNPSLTPFMHRFKNVLSGWELEITFTVPTDGKIC